jgi:predicted dehydrogenase
MKLGVVGCGHWGRHYVRLLRESRQDVVAVCDADGARLADLAHLHPGTLTTTDPAAVFAEPSIDAVVIATPASSHARLAEAALRSGKHVLVEKPMALVVDDACRLVELAAHAGRVLMVGHTFLYNDCVRSLAKVLRSPESGDVYYLTSRRNHLGLIRDDVSALWDLAPHDVSIFCHLLGAEPEWASGAEVRRLRSGVGDAAFATLGFPGGVLAQLEVSWVDAHKLREVVVVTSRRRLVFDDLDALEPLRIYEKGVTTEKDAQGFGEFRLLLRDGSIVSPRVEQREPLRNLVEHFLDCVQHGKTPLSGGESGLRVVRVLAAVQRSIERNGARVSVR